MKKSITVKPKRGRPPSGGRDPFVGIRLPASLLEQIGLWSEKHEAATRSEAIRRLVELGLTVKPALRPSAKAAARAAELAAKVIDRHIDPKAPIEEREVRKQRLLKGPPVFRDLRKDLAK
jgi:antitoxin component of MazEF toxin-antitoxin module